MYSHILIRFGELSTKGKNKMSFVRHLGKNIEKLINVKPRIEFDRMYLEYSEENMNNLQNIFGIQSYSPVVSTETNKESIEATISKMLENKKGKTFKVVVKRHWKGYEGSSMEIASSLGGHILRNFEYTVDVKNPDFKVEVEIRQDKTYVFVDRINGLGGYPTGINGKVLHLISGGIDSPVAAWEMMKRGIHVDFLNFITPPHTDNLTTKKVEDLINLLIKYQGDAKLYRSNYTDLMNYIGLTSNQSFKITLMRRSFYRIADTLCRRNKYLGISNGDNVGQVASQTLESMGVIQEVTNIPIYRPILTSDKLETINKGIKIGTYEISIRPGNEACELFAPAKPVIKPRLVDAQRLESELSQLKEFEDKNVNYEIEIVKFN